MVVGDREKTAVGPALGGLMLGTRRSELLKLRWENVDLEAATVQLLDTKAGNDHLLPIPPAAVSILEHLPHMLHNPHVFPSPVPKERGEPMKDVKRQWKRIRQDVNIAIWSTANAERVAELHTAAKNDAETYRTFVLDEMRKTGAKPFDVRLHDMWRTFGSWSAISGESLAVIGGVLNHADANTTAVYARLNQDVKRNALANHAGALMALVNGSNS